MREPLRPALVSAYVALLVCIILAFFIPFPWNALVVIGGISVEVLELIWGRRLARRWRPQTGAEAMIGLEAEVVSACRPTGQVRVKGELWEATCAAGVDAGGTVIVKRLDGLTLVVDPAPAPGAHPVGTT
jgi:membrane protein implicated in regulation of membrane protease activity